MTDEDMEEAYGQKKAAAPERSEPESVDEEAAENTEILVEKDKLSPDCKVGDEYTFKVTKHYGDEALLELVKKGEPEETEEEPMMATNREIDAMSEGY